MITLNSTEFARIGCSPARCMAASEDSVPGREVSLWHDDIVSGWRDLSGPHNVVAPLIERWTERPRRLEES